MRSSCGRIALRSTRYRFVEEPSRVRVHVCAARFLGSESSTSNISTVCSPAARHRQHRWLSSNAAVATVFDEPHYEPSSGLGHTTSSSNGPTRSCTEHENTASQVPVRGQRAGASPSTNDNQEISTADSPTETITSTPATRKQRRRSGLPKRGKGVLGKINARLKTNKSAETSLELADLLLQLIDEKLSDLTAVKLTPQTVNRVLSAGMKHGSNAEFVGRLDSIMEGLEEIARMDSSSKRSSSSSLPYDARTYSIVAELWGRSGIANSQHRIQRIIKTLARSRQKEAPTECERILTMMQERNIERTTTCFNACLDAWAKSGRSDATRKAEDLLVSMQQQGIQPNFISFTTIIDCCAKSRDFHATQKAEEVLRLMQELDNSGMPGVRPTTVTFNAAINAYSKGPTRFEFAENADRLLQEMKALSDAGDANVSPDRITYTTCINAYSKVKMNRAAVRSVELLREMEKQYMEGGNDTVSPDLYAYNAVLRTLGNQDKGYHATEAESILNEMIYLHEQGHRRVKPDILSYNSVIRSCILHTKRSAKDKQLALKVAIRTLARIRSDGGKFGLKADSFTFSYFFKACAATASASQLEELLRASFKWCCNSGSLNDRVLDALKQSAYPTLVQNLLGTSKEVKSVMVDDLPAEWSRRGRSNGR